MPHLKQEGTRGKCASVLKLLEKDYKGKQLLIINIRFPLIISITNVKWLPTRVSPEISLERNVTVYSWL